METGDIHIVSTRTVSSTYRRTLPPEVIFRLKKLKKNISHSCGVKSKTHPDTLLEQSKEEQENETVSPEVPFGAKGITRVDTPRKSIHNVSCQPLNDTSNSLEVLDKEKYFKKEETDKFG